VAGPFSIVLVTASPDAKTTRLVPPTPHQMGPINGSLRLLAAKHVRE
jgi:hypothetical protein